MTSARAPPARAGCSCWSRGLVPSRDVSHRPGAIAHALTRVDDAGWEAEAGHDVQRAVSGGPSGEAGSVLVPSRVKWGTLL